MKQQDKASTYMLSPLRILLVTLAIVFVAEVLIMFLLPVLMPGVQGPASALADSSMLTILVVPFLWWIIVRPLRKAAITEMARAAAIVSHAMDGILTFDDRGVVEQFNPAAERMFAYAAGEVIGKNVDMLVPAADAEGRNQFISQFPGAARETFIGVIPETLGRRKDGTTFPMEFSVSKMRLQDRRMFIGILRDISERKRAEDALRSSEERVRLLLDSTAEAIYGIDLLGNCTFTNAACMRMLGYESSETVMGRNMHDLIHHTRADGSAYPVAECRIFQAFRRGEGSHVDNEVLWRADRTSFPAEYWSYPVRSGAKVNGSVVTFLDITERKRVEEAQARLTAIVEATTDFVGIANAEGQVIYINKEGRKMVGNGEDENISGFRVVDYYPERLRALILGEAIPVAIREGAWSGETVLLARDGREIPVSQVILAHKAADGTVKYLSTIIRDTTERQRAEADLRRAKEAAEAANRAKSDFLANMSHEIRTPMNGVIGMTELALDTELTTEQREYLEMVKLSAHSLLAVINDILDFSKIEAGKLELDPIEFNPRDNIGNMAKTMALKAHQMGLEMVVDIQPGLPETLIGDPTRLRQILVNLVGNAIKFTKQGEIVLRVEAEEQAGESVYLHFSVKDTGIGIPQERQKLIFEAFTQADSSMTRKFGGTGLGLTISSSLVQLMGGRVWVESEPGKGSTFHFTARFGLGKVPTSRVPTQDLVDLRNMSVLVVDDNATNRRMLEGMLLGWSMTPTLAEGGREALAILHKAKEGGKPFPLVLTDMQMPGMDGFTLAERIKDDPALAGATIMMLTSAGQRGDAARCRELGIAAYLTKPIRQSDLREAILTALDNRSVEKDPVALVTRHSLREARRILRILLAEDNPVNQTLAIRLLEKHGHTVVVANNGREALTILENSALGVFDLALMDIQMPEMDGFEATAAIREKEKSSGKHLPIIALTAHAMKGDQDRCKAAGMDGYVSKPIRPDELFQAIESHVGIPSVQVPSAPVNQIPAEALDRGAMLNCVDGDLELLQRLVEVFWEDCPRMMSDIRKALDSQSSKALLSTAHALKGSLSYFGATSAFQAALRLEMLGREGTLEDAENVFLELEEGLSRLKPALVELGKGSGS